MMSGKITDFPRLVLQRRRTGVTLIGGPSWVLLAFRSRQERQEAKSAKGKEAKQTN
jgi:hypothetical protein